MKCNKDCLNCIYSDCINDIIDVYDELESERIDRENIKQRTPQEQKRWSDYNRSYKKKLANKKYMQTEKGRLNARMASKRYQESHREQVNEKNKRYYEKHKNEINARRKAKRLQNIEEARARDRARYRARKERMMIEQQEIRHSI